MIAVAKPYSLDEQFSWSDLPLQEEVHAGAGGARSWAMSIRIEVEQASRRDRERMAKPERQS